MFDRALALLMAATLLLGGQLKFEVASLKPSAPGTPGPMIRPAPGGERYEATAVTLKTMIETAYRLRADQISGGPDWMDRDRFDLEAKAEKPSSSAELREMLKSVLAERFGLRFRVEEKELPVYVLSLDPGGSKLTAHGAKDAAEARVELTPTQPLHLKVMGTAASMDFFAFRLGYLLDRPVVDRTGLKGDYDFVLTYTMEAPESMHEGMVGHDGRPIDFTGPTIFSAIRQQLGLRLEAGKAPLQTFRIERAEKPAGN